MASSKTSVDPNEGNYISEQLLQLLVDHRDQLEAAFFNDPATREADDLRGELERVAGYSLAINTIFNSLPKDIHDGLRQSIRGRRLRSEPTGTQGTGSGGEPQGTGGRQKRRPESRKPTRNWFPSLNRPRDSGD